MIELLKKGRGTLGNSYLLLVYLFLFFTTNVNAHQLSTAYLTLERQSPLIVNGQWQLRGFDLARPLKLDQDGNGQLTWHEVQSHKAQIQAYLLSHLQLAQGSEQCLVQLQPDFQVERHFNQGFIVAEFQAHCSSDGALNIHYQALFADDSDHKVIVNMSGAAQNVSRVISANNPTISLEALGNSSLNNMYVQASEYIEQGIIHIFIGIDHILFLLVLLLTSVVYRHNGMWQAKENYKAIIYSTAYIVTAFTLAHSITLTATAMNWIHFDSRWVEVSIALSVLMAALNNLFPVVIRLGWLTFAFGLLHGMGFAGVLGELGLPSEQKFWSVLAFNIGVELGQLAILALILPVLIVTRQWRWYSIYGVRLGSFVIAAVALNWTIERL